MMTTDEFMAHSRALDRLTMWARCNLFGGMAIGMGGMILGLGSALQGYSGLIYAAICWAIWGSTFIIDRLLWRVAKRHLDRLVAEAHELMGRAQ